MEIVVANQTIFLQTIRESTSYTDAENMNKTTKKNLVSSAFPNDLLQGTISFKIIIKQF